MKRYLVMVFGFAIAGMSQAADPVVEYVRISQRSGTKLVDIEYKVTDADGDDMTISVSGRDHDNGVGVPVNTLSGDGADGETVSGGVHHLTWDAGVDWDGKLTDDFCITIRATDSNGGPAPNGFVRVEGGTFTMGDTWDDGYDDETPTHDVTVSSFRMAVTEVKNQQVADVFQRAYNNGKLIADNDTVKNANGNSQELLDLDDNDCQISFSDDTFSVDDGKGDYPVVEISWYGAAAYCNFLSEKEGLTPAYDFSDWNFCKWSESGYRLPTEAEWEYAARGGQADTDPGGDDDHKYAGSDANTSLDDVAWYWANSGNHMHDVQTRAANELGIHDLSGNVLEWCWDWYDSGYYAESPGTDPRGPGAGSVRVFRGSGWIDYARYCRVADRFWHEAALSNYNIGFRPVLSAGGSVPDEGHSISGAVTGDVREDVTVTLIGADDASTTTASDGTYSFAGLPNGSYTITPEREGYSFDPLFRDVTILVSNVTDVDFASARIQGVHLTYDKLRQEAKTVMATDFDDTVIVTEEVIESKLNTGAGSDSISIGDYLRRGEIVSSTGDNVIDIQTYAYDSTITTGHGDDQLTIGTDATRVNLQFGLGNDTIVIGGKLYEGSIKTGKGNDILKIGSTSLIRGSIDMGAGTDILVLAGLRSDYTIEGADGNYVIRGAHPTNVYNVESIRFALAE